MYRIQRHSNDRLGLHFQIGKGAGYHLYEAAKVNKALPVSIFVGGAPATILSAIAPLPENVPELLFASMVLGKKMGRCTVPSHPHPLLSESDFAILGEADPHERHDEGPFGDHYGYYSLKHPFPVLRVKKIYHRKNAIWPATVVGKPRQEDFYIGEYLQKLLKPLFPIVMPAVKDLWSYGETGFHSLAAAVVKERFAKEAMTSAFRILGEGQLALTKFLILTDQDVDLSDIKAVLKTVLARFNPVSDLYIFSHLSLDTLDYTGPQLNHGSRGVLIGLGAEKRRLATEVTTQFPFRAVPFCPGCLVIESKMSIETLLYQFKGVEGFPLVILVDSIDETLKNNETFLWTVFTRFEPAGDIHFQNPQIIRHHISASLPILIDARFKPSYPKVVEVDPKTKQLVDQRWKEYAIS
jgi:3-polyprenyl-4-hydroxybenzoate decarboxylase